MKITIESTTKIVQLENDGAGVVPARIWEGKTESGIPVHCFITRIAVADKKADHSQFEKELLEQRKPSAVVEAIPLRMIL